MRFIFILYRRLQYGALVQEERKHMQTTAIVYITLLYVHRIHLYARDEFTAIIYV